MDTRQITPPLPTSYLPDPVGVSLSPTPNPLSLEVRFPDGLRGKATFVESALDAVFAPLKDRGRYTSASSFTPNGDPVSNSRLIKVVIIACACACSVPTWAQLDEVVVTGARVSGDDYSRIPAVVLERRADFLVQRIRLTNDTRAEEARVQELHKTIRDMVADAAKRPGMALSHGDEFLIPITATAYEVPLGKGSKRPDTSSTEIYVKTVAGALLEAEANNVTCKPRYQ